ncbi:hypothetical protein D1007_51408 [Hordeum vulgare]|nr:hypothetical protein D1007_51408 [Hordeum vulgare]
MHRPQRPPPLHDAYPSRLQHRGGGAWGLTALHLAMVLEHISPYVVLVIDDNPYGLMVALSYIQRICPYALLEVHLLASKSLYDDQVGIQSIIQRLVIKTQG